MIAVDVGNTNIDFVQEKDGQINPKHIIFTSTADTKTIKSIVQRYPREKFAICSVVPSVTEIFRKLQKVLYPRGEKIFIAGENLEIPIKSRYNRKKVGMDRLVAAFAAGSIYPGTRLVIDLGTATTFDFLSKSGVYMGGLILPGVGSTLKVLSSCALLPKEIKLIHTKKNVPTDTIESISKGIELGFSAMINSLVAIYRQKLKISRRESIVLTGGQYDIITPFLNFKHKKEPFLVIKGLILLAKKYF